jgi:radical SAM superfamily enzyme YgiQ (UPF0313 family)
LGPEDRGGIDLDFRTTPYARGLREIFFISKEDMQINALPRTYLSPPSEADSLLIQATVGCPHNKCTFCMVYKNGPKFKVRPTAEIIEDMYAAREQFGASVRTMFLSAVNSIAVPTADLVHICQAAREIFPLLERKMSTCAGGKAKFFDSPGNLCAGFSSLRGAFFSAVGHSGITQSGR